MRDVAEAIESVAFAALAGWISYLYFLADKAVP